MLMSVQRSGSATGMLEASSRNCGSAKLFEILLRVKARSKKNAVVNPKERYEKKVGMLRKSNVKKVEVY